MTTPRHIYILLCMAMIAMQSSCSNGDYDRSDLAASVPADAQLVWVPDSATALSLAKETVGVEEYVVARGAICFVDADHRVWLLYNINDREALLDHLGSNSRRMSDEGDVPCYYTADHACMVRQAQLWITDADAAVDDLLAVLEVANAESLRTARQVAKAYDALAPDRTLLATGAFNGALMLAEDAWVIGEGTITDGILNVRASALRPSGDRVDILPQLTAVSDAPLRFMPPYNDVNILAGCARLDWDEFYHYVQPLLPITGQMAMKAAIPYLQCIDGTVGVSFTFDRSVGTFENLVAVAPMPAADARRAADRAADLRRAYPHELLDLLKFRVDGNNLLVSAQEVFDFRGDADYRQRAAATTVDGESVRLYVCDSHRDITIVLSGADIVVTTPLDIIKI